MSNDRLSKTKNEQNQFRNILKQRGKSTPPPIIRNEFAEEMAQYKGGFLCGLCFLNFRFTSFFVEHTLYDVNLLTYVCVL